MPTIDDIARRAAAELRAEVRATLDVDARLATVASTGSVRPADVISIRRRWAWIGSAAVLVLGLVGAGIVIVRDDDPAPPTATSMPTPDSTDQTTTPTTVLVPTPSLTTIAATTPSTVPGATPSTSPSTSDASTTSTAASTTTERPATSTAADIVTLDATSRVFGAGVEVGVPPCAPDACPSVAVTEDGTLVAYEAATNTLRIAIRGSVFETTALAIAEDLDAEYGFLALTGPDDVAYLAVQPNDVQDPVGDLVAVSLSGPNAGAVITRATGVLDMSGDSDLVATRDGIVQVGCCGPEQRPDPGDSPVMTWVDREGDAVVRDGPQVSFVAGNDGFQVVRTDPDGAERRWMLPSELAARGTPDSVALLAGDVLAAWDDWTTQQQFVMRFTSSGEVQRVVLGELRVETFDPYGGAITYDGERYRSLQLPALAQPTDAIDFVHEGMASSYSTPQAAIDALLARWRVPDGCEAAPTADVVDQSGVDPVIATIAVRSGCDDSGAGFDLVVEIGSAADPPAGWYVQVATSRGACLRGASGTACV
jgi:hypothetical protein